MGKLEEDEDGGTRIGGAERGPRLTRNERGREGRKDRARWSSCTIPSTFILSSAPFSPPLFLGEEDEYPGLLLLSFTTRSCDMKCLMFCLAAWTNRSSMSIPRMWEGLNLLAIASVMWPVPQPTSSTFLSLNQSGSRSLRRGSSSAPTRPSHSSP